MIKPDCDPLVSCPHCGCINEATVTNAEDTVQHLLLGTVTVFVPLWTCNNCNEKWTGHQAEAIRDRAVADALDEMKMKGYGHGV